MRQRGTGLIATIAMLVLSGRALAQSTQLPDSGKCLATDFGDNLILKMLFVPVKAIFGTCIPEWAGYLVAILFIIVLGVLYIPKIYGSLRDTFGRGHRLREALQLEKTRNEILKIKYEVAAIVKQHGLAEITLAPEFDIGARQFEKEVAKIEQRRSTVRSRNQAPQFEEKPHILRRAGAIVLDYFGFLLFSAFTAAFAEAIIDPTGGIEAQDALFISLLVLTAIVYFVLLPYWIGGTFGKRLVGLKIVESDGADLSLWRSLLRFVIWAPSILIAGIGFWVVFFHPRKLALYDWLAGTRVVRAHPKASAEAQAAPQAR